MPTDAYWGNPQRYQFKAMIDSFGFQTELAQNDERIVRSTLSIKINGYIIQIHSKKMLLLLINSLIK